jgi:membrane fusion protein (multidrug efflux system)
MEVKAAFNKALRDFERNKKLFETRDISEYMFENIRLQRESAEAALKMAEANLQLAQRQLNDCTIESPIDGIVATRLAEFGNTVAPGTPLMKVVNIMSVRLKFGVAEKDVARITAGQPASALIPALPGKTFDGTVTAISPQADLTTRTFPVEVTIENRNYELKAGMAATVRLVSPDRREFPLLPKSALIERGGETIVYVVKNGRAEKRMPELGPESGDSIAVIRGVEAGEEVVVLGQENLIPGSDVRIKN